MSSVGRDEGALDSFRPGAFPFAFVLDKDVMLRLCVDFFTVSGLQTKQFISLEVKPECVTVTFDGAEPVRPPCLRPP